MPRRRRRGVAYPTNISTPFQLSQDSFLFCELYSDAPKFPTCCHTQMIPRDLCLANSNYIYLTSDPNVELVPFEWTFNTG